MPVRSACLILALIAASVGAAQAQTLPPQGTEATFDVATWNIENFGTGSGGTAQREAAAEIIRQADVDLWALQEIVDANDFTALLQELNADGYVGVLGPSPSAGNQRLAYIYKEDVVTVLFTRTVLQGNEFAFASRLPFEMRANVTVNGQAQTLWILNFHA
ncbi:MAG: endonuclease/exonuclease/phosphatase family protein, partial [Bacteroidota bacterium]